MINLSIRKSGPADISASRWDAVGNTHHLDAILAKNGSAESNEASSPGRKGRRGRQGTSSNTAKGGSHPNPHWGYAAVNKAGRAQGQSETHSGEMFQMMRFWREQTGKCRAWDLVRSWFTNPSRENPSGGTVRRNVNRGRILGRWRSHREFS